MIISAPSVKENFRNNRILYLIILGTFLASLFYSFGFQIKPAVDAKAYDKIAVNIVSGNGYREDLSKDFSQDGAITRVGPLYEYFLASIYAVFGHNYGVVWIIQALLRAASVWLLYLTASLVLASLDRAKTMALAAAGIFAFYPDLIEISAMLLTETLGIFLICLTLYAFFRYLSAPSWPVLLGLAVFLGLAVLARPPVLFFVPVVIFYFWRQRTYYRLVFFLFLLMLVFVPWTGRNFFVYHEFMPFGAAGNFNFWIGNYHGGRGEQEPNQEQFDFETTHSIEEINAKSMRQFKKFVIQYPGEFVGLTFMRVSKYFSFVRPIGFWFYQKGIGQLLVVASSALASIFLFILSFGGMWETVRLKNKRLLYLLAFTAATPLVLFITVVETRYRFPIYPLLAIFAGFFIIKLFEERKWWLNKTLLTATIILSGNAIVDLWLNFDRFKDRIF